MKKVFISIAAIISTMIFIASPLFYKPLKVYADDRVMDVPPVAILEELWTDDGRTDRYVSLQSKLNGQHVESDCAVLYMNMGLRDNSVMQYMTFFLHYKTADISFDNNVLTIENATSGSIYQQKWHQNNGEPYTDYRQDFTSGTIDFSTGSYTFYNGQNTVFNYSTGMPIQFVTNIYSNIPDTIISNSLNVVVDFSPDLDNNVFRAPLPDNGVTDYSKYFTMDITNNSNFGIQYFMALQEFPTDRNNINNFIPYPYSGFCSNTFNEQVFANEEWLYIHPMHANGVVKVLKPSQWHYIGSGESIHQEFSWSQFNLEKGKQYQAVVFAVRNDVGCASALNTYINGDFGDSTITPYVIDYSEAECVYYSSFIISNPMTYDPNDNKFGNYISSGDKSDAALYNTKAYEDPNNGNVVIANKIVSDFEDVTGAPSASSGSHGGGGYYTGSSYNSGSYYNGSSYNSYSGNFSSLNSYFSSFFGFITAVLNCFPSAYVVIITAGLSGLVVLGLIKVAIK